MAITVEPTLIETNGITLAAYERAPEDEAKPLPVVFCHGFPELGYSWRYQLDALSQAGYHALAPDMRGFGRSSVPGDVTAYTMEQCCADVAGLIRAKGYDKAVLVGHDFGGLLVWSMPFYQPDVIAGIASICTPFTPRAKHEPISMFNHIYGEDNYINRFQEPGFMEARFNPDMAKVFRMLMRSDEGQGTPLGNPDELNVKMMEWWKHIEEDESQWGGRVFLSEDEINTYADEYKRAGGFTGGFNWYRNITQGWERMADFQTPGKKIHFDFPVLQMMPDRDPSSPPFLADAMPKFCNDYAYQLITGAGHWAQQEQPDQVNEALLGWLKEKFD